MNLAFEDILQSSSVAEIQQKVYQLIAYMNNQAVEIQHAIDTNFRILNQNFYPLRDLRIAVQKAAVGIEKQSSEIQGLQEKIQLQYSEFAKLQLNAIEAINQKIEAKKYYIFKDFAELVLRQDCFSVQQLIIDCGDQFSRCEDNALLLKNAYALVEQIKLHASETYFLLNIGVYQNAVSALRLLSSIGVLIDEQSPRVRLGYLEDLNASHYSSVVLFALETVQLLDPLSSGFEEDYNSVTSIFNLRGSFSFATTRIPLSDVGSLFSQEIESHLDELDRTNVELYASRGKNIEAFFGKYLQGEKIDLNERLYACADAIISDKVAQLLSERAKESSFLYAQYLIRNMQSEQAFELRTMQLYLDIGISYDEAARMYFYLTYLYSEIEKNAARFALKHVNYQNMCRIVESVFFVGISDNLRGVIENAQFMEFYATLIMHYVFKCDLGQFYNTIVDYILCCEPSTEAAAVAICYYILDLHTYISRIPQYTIFSQITKFFQAEALTVNDFLLEHRADVQTIYNATTAAYKVYPACSSAPQENNSLRSTIYTIFTRLVERYLQVADFQAVSASRVLAILLLFIITIGSIHIQRQSLYLTGIVEYFLITHDIAACELTDVIREFNEITG